MEIGRVGIIPIDLELFLELKPQEDKRWAAGSSGKTPPPGAWPISGTVLSYP